MSKKMLEEVSTRVGVADKPYKSEQEEEEEEEETAQ